MNYGLCLSLFALLGAANALNCKQCSKVTGNAMGGVPLNLNLPDADPNCDSSNLGSVREYQNCKSFCIAEHIDMSMEAGPMKTEQHIFVRGCADQVIKGNRVAAETNDCCLTFSFKMGGGGMGVGMSVSQGGCLCHGNDCNTKTAQQMTDWKGALCKNPCPAPNCPNCQPSDVFSYTCNGKNPTNPTNPSPPGSCTRNCGAHGRCAIYESFQYCACDAGWSGPSCSTNKIRCFDCTTMSVETSHVVCSGDASHQCSNNFCLGQYAGSDSGHVGVVTSSCITLNPLANGLKPPNCQKITVSGSESGRVEQCVCNTDYCNGCYPDPCSGKGTCSIAFPNDKPKIICTCNQGSSGEYCQGGPATNQPGGPTNQPGGRTNQPNGPSTTPNGAESRATAATGLIAVASLVINAFY